MLACFAEARQAAARYDALSTGFGGWSRSKLSRRSGWGAAFGSGSRGGASL